MQTAPGAVTVFLTVGMIRPSGFGANVSEYVRRALGTPAETPAAILADLQGAMMDRLIWYPLGRLVVADGREARSHGHARYIGLRLVVCGRGRKRPSGR